jgi:zinc transporter ZupT
MGIALFHLLPESIESIEAYFKDSDSFWKKIPLSFFLAFLSYSLILFVEKIAFDSHSLIDHEHDHGKHSHDHVHSHNHELRSNKNKDTSESLENSQEAQHKSGKNIDENQLAENLIHNHEDNDESSDSDVEEEALKTVVSSIGKLASFMHMRNSIAECGGPNNHSSSKQDKALLKASRILKRTLTASHTPYKEEDNDDMKYMVNPKNVHVDDEKNIPAIQRQPSIVHMKTPSNITPFLLLIALSLHGFFEGLALGIQAEVKDTLFLAVAILAHKWAEAFTLVINLL